MVILSGSLVFNCGDGSAQWIVGWIKETGWDQLRSLLGLQRRVITYPSLAEDPEVIQEREQLGHSDE